MKNIPHVAFGGDPSHAYQSAAVFAAALYNGLVPRTVAFEDGAIRDEVPLLPDDLLRESPLFLAQAEVYSDARIQRMVEQGLWSIGILAARWLAASLVREHDFTLGKPAKPTPETLTTHVNDLLHHLFDENGMVQHDEPVFHNREGADRAGAELEQIITRLTLLTHWNASQRNDQIRRCFEETGRTLAVYWDEVEALASHLLCVGPLERADVLRLAGNILDRRFRDRPDYLLLFAYVRFAIDALDTASAAAQELIRLTGGDRCWSEQQVQEFLLAATPPKPLHHDLSGVPAIHRAAQIFVAIYNGASLELDDSWCLSEVLPYRYIQIPSVWLEEHRTYLDQDTWQALVFESHWELQSLLAGFIAVRIQQQPGFVPHQEVGELLGMLLGTCREALERAALLVDCQGELEEFLESAVEAAGDILHQNWHLVCLLAENLGGKEPPEMEKIRAAVGHLEGARHQGNAAGFICQYVRERMLSDHLRAQSVT